MATPLRVTGVVLIIIGVLAWVAAGYAYTRAQAGADALQGFSTAQNVTLSYNEDGDLTDRGTTEGADEILALLGGKEAGEWGWPVDKGELNKNDRVVNTATEYMYQMATIAQHTLHGEQTIVLPERVEWDGDGDGTVAADAPEYYGGEWDPSTSREDAIFNAGTYTVPVNERYWTGFNRVHPLDGPAREQTWNGTVHGLFAQLGVGATTATSLQMAMGIVGVTALMGVGFVVGGAGLVWAGTVVRRKEQPAVA